MMKKVLITGGLGFLGSYCIEKFKSEGFLVTVIDNLTSNVISPDDIICDGCEIIIEDIILHDWENDKNNYDLILHLASPVGPVGILKHSGKMADIILKDIYSVIFGAQKYKCPLIFVSTSEIYGHRDKPTFLKENDDKILVGDFSVRNEYSVAKLLCEIVLSNTSKISNLRYQIIRPFNISGARQLKTGGFVLPTFVTQSLDNKDITVFYNGDQVRAFTHVKDIVDGIFLVSNCESYNNIWNIGNDENVSTINFLAEKVKEKTKTKSDIKKVDPKTIHGELYEEAWDKIPDSTKIKTELGWNPKFDKEEIIDDVINFYYKKNK